MTSSFRAGLMAALTALVLAPSMAVADDVTVGALVIQHPWARATPNGAAVAGGYLSVSNHGTEADTLTGGSLEAAAKFAIHDMATVNGVMTMRPSGPIEIPPGATLTLEPSGRHIMFTGLKQGLRKGQSIDGTLVFARAGTVRVRFNVEGIGAKAPTGHTGPAMPGMDKE